MKFGKKGLALALAMGLAPSLMLGATDAASQLILKLANGQVTIVKEFQGLGNLMGFVVEPTRGPKQDSIVYADKNGLYMVAGSVISPQGSNVAQDDYNKYVTSAKAPGAYAQAQKTAWFQDGKASAPHKAYVLIEPNCIACHMLYQQMKPMIDSGQLAVRWIPVAFRTPASAGMAVAMMQAPNPGAALAQNEKGFDEKTETGGIKPVAVGADVKKKLDANLNFMMTSGFVGTPVIIYKTTAGDFKVVPGALGGKELQDAINSMSAQF